MNPPYYWQEMSRLDDVMIKSCFAGFTASRELLQGDSRGYRSAEEAARELTNGIRREVSKLAERWAALRDRTERWSVDLDTTSSVSFCLTLDVVC